MPPPPPPRRGQHDHHHIAMMNGRFGPGGGNRHNNNNGNGIKRLSRKIWDEARHFNYGNDDDSTTITKRRLYAYCRAICYELQPIRLNNQIQFDVMLSTIKSTIVYTLRDICWHGIIKNVPYASRSLLQFLQTRTYHQWCIVAGVILYYYFVRFIHE